MSPQIKSTLLSLIAALMWLPGCGDLIVQLDVPEMPRLPINRAATMPITIVEFRDARQDTSRIGTFRNAFGWEMYDIREKSDVSAWVTEGIRDVFQRAGVTAEIVPSTPEPREGALSIGGEVNLLFSEMTSDSWFQYYLAELRVTITVVVDFTQYKRNFRGESRNSNEFHFGLEGEYEDTLSNALLDLATKVIQEIDELLERRRG